MTLRIVYIFALLYIFQLAAAPDETFSTERTVKPTGKEDPNLEKSYSLFSASSADSSSTLTLLQKANAAVC